MRRIYTLIPVFILFVPLAFAIETNPAQAPQKVMIIIFENADYQTVLASPHFSKLAQEGALLTNMSSVIHPSQGNYIALVSGNTYGIDSDKLVNLDVKHIGDLIEAHGKNWKIYSEQYPGSCFLGKSSGTYVRKHNPFISFKNIQDNKARCNAHIVNASTLSTDIQKNALPEFSIYVPDMNNDGHDTSVDFAGQWFTNTFGPLLKDPHFMQDMLVVLTFDESESSSSDQIYTVLYGNSITPGATSGVHYTHYSLLHTIENILSLGDLGQQDTDAPVITGVWKQ